MALGELDYIINMGLYSGDTGSNGDFYEHLEESLDMMNQLRNITIEGIRLDKGFFDQKTFQLLEDLNISYVCKVPLYDSIKEMIAFLNEEDRDSNEEDIMWTPILGRNEPTVQPFIEARNCNAFYHLSAISVMM